MTLSIDIDFRADLGAVRSQGRRPTCLAFASSDAHRHARRHPELLCVEWLFYHVTQLAGTGPHSGTTIPDTRAVMKSIGQPEECVWPYQAVTPDQTTWHPPSVKPRLLTCSSDGCEAGLRVVQEEVEDGVPVVIAMFTSTTFTAPASWQRHGSEIILSRDRGESIDPATGHALVAVGRGRFRGEPVLLLRNSWGPRWGFDGHAWVHEDYLAPRLAGAFVISKEGCDVL